MFRSAAALTLAVAGRVSQAADHDLTVGQTVRSVRVRQVTLPVQIHRFDHLRTTQHKHNSGSNHFHLHQRRSGKQRTPSTFQNKIFRWFHSKSIRPSAAALTGTVTGGCSGTNVYFCETDLKPYTMLYCTVQYSNPKRSGAAACCRVCKTSQSCWTSQTDEEELFFRGLLTSLRKTG